MEGVIITIVVGLAVFCVGRKFYKNIKTAGAPGCSSGCAACGQGAGCTELSSCDKGNRTGSS